jgi:hypothetical protein
VRLDPADVEAIAQRVADLIDARPPRAVRYVDAAHLAEALGVERDWVYAHARQLGAIRLGGPHGRLRFDLPNVQRTLSEQVLARHPPPAARRPGRRRERNATGGVELLAYQS